MSVGTIGDECTHLHSILIHWLEEERLPITIQLPELPLEVLCIAQNQLLLFVVALIRLCWCRNTACTCVCVHASTHASSIVGVSARIILEMHF